MKIAIFNWKDIKNPYAGGAEVLTHEMAKRFVRKGHEVILFVSHFKGASQKETIDGITIIRSGELDLRALHNSVHYKAYQYYQKYLRGKVDVVIDEVHGMPFFAKFYVKEKVFVLICEVADDIWFRMFSFPWNVIGWLLERLYLFLYRDTPIFTISDSTKKELMHVGIAQKDITVLPMGINRVEVTTIKKEKNPTLIFVGRLNKMKGIEDAVVALSKITKTIRQVQLWVVGRGEETFVTHLKTLAQQYNIRVTFWDFVTQEKKFELMAKAHAIVVPSVREGFGLIVPEAGSVGTPAIVYDVHGLRDTVIQDSNGIRVKKSPDALAEGIEKMFRQDQKQYDAMCVAAKRESLRYNWDSTAEVALTMLSK